MNHMYLNCSQVYKWLLRASLLGFVQLFLFSKGFTLAEKNLMVHVNSPTKSVLRAGLKKLVSCHYKNILTLHMM